MKQSAETESGRKFQYENGTRPNPGQGLRIGNDYIEGCYHCRLLVRLFGCIGATPYDKAHMMKAIDWLQMGPSAWLCPRCKDDPMARASAPQRSGRAPLVQGFLPVDGNGHFAGFPPGFAGKPQNDQQQPQQGYPQPAPGAPAGFPAAPQPQQFAPQAPQQQFAPPQQPQQLQPGAPPAGYPQPQGAPQQPQPPQQFQQPGAPPPQGYPQQQPVAHPPPQQQYAPAPQPRSTHRRRSSHSTRPRRCRRPTRRSSSRATRRRRRRWRTRRRPSSRPTHERRTRHRRAARGATGARTLATPRDSRLHRPRATSTWWPTPSKVRSPIWRGHAPSHPAIRTRPSRRAPGGWLHPSGGSRSVVAVIRAPAGVNHGCAPSARRFCRRPQEV